MINDKMNFEPSAAKTQVGTVLLEILADVYNTMYFSQTAHWNVTGENFPQYHTLFDDSYKLCNNALDDIAELARACSGINTPHTLNGLLRLTNDVEGVDSSNPIQVIKHLEACHNSIQSMWEQLSNNCNGMVDVTDFAGSMFRMYSQMAWKLRSISQ